MKCPNCKKEIENDSVFCEYCGTQIKNEKQGLWKILALISAGFIVVWIIDLCFSGDDIGHPAPSIYFYLVVILLVFSIIKILRSKTK